MYISIHLSIYLSPPFELLVFLWHNKMDRWVQKTVKKDAPPWPLSVIHTRAVDLVRRWRLRGNVPLKHENFGPEKTNSVVYSRAIAAFFHFRRVGGEIEDARRWQQDFQKVWNKKEQCDIIIQCFRDDAITKWTEAAKKTEII